MANRRRARRRVARTRGDGDDDVLIAPGTGDRNSVAGESPGGGSHTTDLMQAKQRLSARLLRSGLQGQVVGLRPALRVSVAISAAWRNVHAVGIGRKIVDGLTTDTACVRVYVVQKLARSLLPPKDQIPPQIDGLPTDVIESAPAFITAAARGRRLAQVGIVGVPVAARELGALSPAAPPLAACTAARRKRQDPKVGGISTAHVRVTAGTIAYFCRSTHLGDPAAALYVLSNNHVLASVNDSQIGDDLYQPGPADGGTSGDHFAELHRYVPIALGGQTPNRVDCAIGRLLPGVRVRRQVCTIGPVSGTIAATEQMPVRKHGRTTGYTEGAVGDTSYDALVGMDHEDDSAVALFENQLRMEVSPPYPAFALPGDSGSLVVHGASPAAVGLYFAGPPSGDYGIANRIEDVLSHLEIELV
jgi:hypothetical protein